MRRKLLLLLALALTLAPHAAAADGLTLEQLQAKFPNGKYWNHPAGTPSNPNGWTDTPCSPHSQHNHRQFNGDCGCNCFSGLTIQCEGFAFQLQEDAFGAGFGVSSYRHLRAVWDYAAAMDALKPGDVVRYHTGVWNHSIFITAVDGDRITYGDCNAENTCQIRWNVEGTKSMLAEGFRYMDPGAWALTPAVSTAQPDLSAASAPPAQPEASEAPAVSEPDKPSGTAESGGPPAPTELEDVPEPVERPQPPEPPASDALPGTVSLTLRPDSISLQPRQAPAVSIGLLPPGAAAAEPWLHHLAVCTVVLNAGSLESAFIAVPNSVSENEDAALWGSLSAYGEPAALHLP